VSEILARLQDALRERYAIQRELGRGGMATVYLATDQKHAREVAIKVLHPELASTIGPERFAREIQIAAKLQHPNILSLFDSGEADGLLYYVMPFVYGESLRDRLNRENLLPVDFAIRTALEVLDALGYAHSMGIIHRDIKPENIMLAGGHALVTDFGIARAVTEAGSEQKLTQTGTAVGTPLYMSPEQAVGDHVGPTSDLYSVGCVLYEMLAGTPPFTGPNARAIMARHAMEQVPSVQVVRDTVPDEVEDAIMAALGKVPADRPQTAQQFAEMLQMGLQVTGMAWTATRAAQRRTAARTAQHTAAHRATLGLPETRSRRRWLLQGGVATLVVALVGGGLGFKYFRKPIVATAGFELNRVAVLYFQDQSPDRRLGHIADGLTEALIGELARVPALEVISASGSAAWRDARVPRDSIARALQAGLLVTGTVEPEADKLRVTLKLVDGASDADFGRASLLAPAGEVLALRDSIASEAARLIRQQLGTEVQLRSQRAGTRNAQAWSLLQQAHRVQRQADSALKAGDTERFDRDYTTADSILQKAEALDPAWPDPVTRRAALAFARSRNSGDLATLIRNIDQGLALVGRAVALDRTNADALELRGNLRYWRWLNQLEREPAKAKALFDSARADLEAAKAINPAQAGAWASLSHLYTNDPTKTGTDIRYAAERALEADAFLGNADVILQRLFFANYDDDAYIGARDACDRGARRFPDKAVFLKCQLWVQTMRGHPSPDPALAWRLADSTIRLTDPRDRAYEELEVRIVTAGVLARAGLADSARAVLKRSLGTPSVDPSRDLALRAAFVYTLLGDKPQALEQLRVYLAENPTYRANLRQDTGWWFRSLTDDPGFRELIRAR